MATILVIDDEESIRNLLKEVLERANHRVLEACDGREGLTLYQQNKVDLVLMDILMPGTDGLETTLQLTREYLDAKVIAMTGAHSRDTPQARRSHRRRSERSATATPIRCSAGRRRRTVRS